MTQLALNLSEADFSGGNYTVIAAHADTAVRIVISNLLIQPTAADLLTLTLKAGATALTGGFILDQSGAAGTPFLPLYGTIVLPRNTALILNAVGTPFDISLTGQWQYQY